jgi:hypothetical protein
MMGKYHVSLSADQRHYFDLRANNGERILQSQMYTSKAAALVGIASCIENSGADAQYDRLTSVGSEPYFVLKAKNHEVIGTSEMYSSTQARDAGIASCVANGPSSPTQDDTVA